MGWNEGFTIFEKTVIGAYDIGKLDKELLKVLMKPYRNTDIDSGGLVGFISKDGKYLDQIVIEAWGLDVPKRPTCKQVDNPCAWEYYYNEMDEKFMSVTNYFGWKLEK